MARKPKTIVDEISNDLNELLANETLAPMEATPEPAPEVVAVPVEVTPEVTEAPVPEVVVKEPYLSAKTLAEMEGGRQSIARYKAP